MESANTKQFGSLNPNSNSNSNSNFSGASVFSQTQEGVVNFQELLGIVLSHRWAVLGVMFICILLAGLYCKIATPVYQSDLLMNTNVNSDGNSIGSLMGSNVNYFNFGRPDSATEEQILVSRSVLAPVVEKLNLDLHISPRYFPVIGPMLARRYDQTNYQHLPNSPLLGLSQYDWGGNQMTVQNFKVSDDLKGQRFVIKFLGKQTYELMQQDGNLILKNADIGKFYQVDPTGHSHLEIQVRSIDANTGAEFFVSQARMEDAIDQLNRDLKIVDSGRMTNLIQLELTGTDPNLTALTLNEIGSSAVLFDINSQAQEASKTLIFLKARIPAVKQSLDLAETKLNNYMAASGNIELTDEGKMLLQKMGELATQASNLEVQRAQLKQQYTDQSFQVQQVNTALAQLQAEQRSLETEIRHLPQADQIQVGLRRDAMVQNKIYVNLLDKIQQFEILQAGTVGKVAIVDEAAVPYKSINKSPLLIIGMAALLGLVLSIGFFIIRQFLFKGVEDPDVIETQLGLPVYGAIQESKDQQQQLRQLDLKQRKYLQFLSEMNPHDLVVESLRSLRTNLLFELPKAKNNIIAISGPTPGVGKSFISVNFAQILADSGHRVLLIDADIRRGGAHVYFEAPRTPGFCDLIDQKVSLDSVIRKSRQPNLDFISTGTMPGKHAEFLMRPKVKEILDQLSQQYEYLIFDTAPILAVTDALQLFRHAGTHLLVFGYGKHTLKEIEHSILTFEKGGVSINGCIFNRIKQAHSYYGKKYKYNYKYDYQYKKRSSD